MLAQKSLETTHSYTKVNLGKLTEYCPCNIHHMLFEDKLYGEFEQRSSIL